MKKLLFLFIFTFLFARINPFVPVVKPQNTIIVNPSYFKEAKVYLPSDARVLKKVIFVYQSVSGDIKEKTVEINKHIDFHKPIYISHTPKKFPMEELNFLDLFKMYIKNKKIFIQTKDKLLRNFFLVKPFRIVLDFKRDADFLTIKKYLKNSFVKKVVVGNHNGYYRVVIYFDAKYMYKLTKTQEGIKIELQ
ncbi:AMIN domain-containing protein [Nautilia sp. PV-1]|uniref:AMIN domain-containing protein n=1 Tax=Nautilia sp. PV-1 TaxID=2579250 RepID=UPI000FD78F93|nr:AMIN domain-containing protein [Nautilia sp. PV-1]AZV45978.1 AMIN domain-containing protein [Nautilia sp. PV-1]